jgi:Fe-S cluster biosynthesis and repair protein YggX
MSCGNVPKKGPENHQLAVWVKWQRRQFTLIGERKYSNLTKERIEKLQVLGFDFNPRVKKNDISWFK